MSRIVIVHDVADVDVWLQGKAERAEAIGSMGGTNVVDHVAHDGSQRVAISAETDDVDGVLAAAASPTPEIVAAMERHGVRQPLTIYVER